jgi:hypothetical protein
MIRTALALSLAVSAAGTAAQAEPAQPSIDNVYAVVDCLMQRGNRNMERVLSTVPGTLDADAPWVAGGVYACRAAGTQVPAASFYNRGAVAERLLYRDFEAIGARPRGRAARVFEPVSGYYVRYADESARAALSMLGLAACVVRADPGQSYAFFRTARGSAAERGAIENLTGAISGCVGQGENIDLSPPVFRAFLAEAAYRAAAGRPEVFRAE